MDYFKKCPKCGRCMKPYMHYKLGSSYTVWICDCSYFENDTGTVTGNVTTNTGGGASDHTGNNSGNCKSKQS